MSTQYKNLMENKDRQGKEILENKADAVLKRLREDNKKWTIKIHKTKKIQ